MPLRRGADRLTLLGRVTDVLWAGLRGDGVDVQIRRGAADDPLGGIVRFRAAGELPVDLVVGKTAWQAAAIARARRSRIEGLDIPVVTATDLVLLKLYAGGPQDAWDVQPLLAGHDEAHLTADVERELAALPAVSRRLWHRIRAVERP